MSLSEVWCCLVEYVEPLAKALQEAGEAAPKFRNPVPGEACVARLPSSTRSEEGSGDEVLTPWARAVVRSRPSPAKLELFFVDMGGTRVVHHTEVKQIPAELTAQSGCAFQCVLSCNFPVDPAELSAKILYKDLVLQVEQQLEPAKVIGSLFDTSGEDEVNVLDSFAPPPPPSPPAVEPPASDVELAQNTVPTVEAGPAEADTEPTVEAGEVDNYTKPTVEAGEAEADIQPAVEGEAAEADTVPPAVELEAVSEVTAAKPEETTPKPFPPRARVSPPGRSSQPNFRRGPIVPCYPPLSKISGKMLALVMHVEDLSCFYIMREEQSRAMNDLSDRLQRHYGEAPEPVVCPLPRLPCVAFYPHDKMWYRAKVIADGSCVQFIDYGNVDSIPEVRAIAAEFLEVPPFCYKCKLDGAKDLANCARDMNDIFALVNAFKMLVSDRPVEVEVVAWGPEVTVRVCVDGEDVSTALKKTCASFETPTLKSKETVETEAYAAVPQSREAVVVSHVDALNSFYVQFSARLGDLDVLGEKLQEALASGAATAVETPDSNTLYAALYTDDGLWYRARVEGPGDDGSGLRVRFVDYGNAQTVESVVSLNLEDLKVEPFCTECQLFGVSAADSMSALEKFKELVLDSDLLIETVAPLKPLAVRLFTADGTDLLSQLPLPKRYSTTEVPLHQKVVVQISHVESATDFYVNLGDSLDGLQSLAEHLLEVPVNDNTPVDTSLPCMVYWTDELPYRITVLKDEVECTAEGPALALVKFVDYGNTDAVNRAGIRPLPDGLVDIPLFAINCTLDVPEGKLGNEATEKLQLLAESEPGTSLLAEFLEHRDGRYVIRLLDMGIDVLERLLQGTTQDASRENAAMCSSHVQSSVLAETLEAPFGFADTSGAGNPDIGSNREGEDLNSTVLAADLVSCNIEDSVVENGEVEREDQPIEKAELQECEEPTLQDKILQDEEKAIEPAIKAEQSELEEATAKTSSSAVTSENVAENGAEQEKTDSSDGCQTAVVEEEVFLEEFQQCDTLPVVATVDTLPKEQESHLPVMCEDHAPLKETEVVADISAMSKDDVLPEVPVHDEADLSVPAEECTFSEDVCEATVFEDSVSDDNVDNGTTEAPMEDAVQVAANEGVIFNTETHHVISPAEVAKEKAEVEGDTRNLVDESAEHGASEAEHQAAGSTGDDGTPPKSSTLAPEGGDVPSSKQRAGADDSSATGTVAISDFGAGGDTEPAKVPLSIVAESSPSTPSRRSGKMSPDDRPIPGVCTNAELLGAPSDT